MPHPIAWTLLGLSAFGTCTGNLLLKQANLAVPDSGMVAIATSPWFIGAMVCYVFDLVLFAQALQNLPVSSAIPVVSGIRIVATTVLANVFFGETLTSIQIIASGVITVGIIVISRA